MKHICVIGAGISGLTTAKTFLQKGYKVTVLEKSSGVGGVWERSRSYIGVATQTTRDEYAFSDFPMPADYPMWPSGSQVEAYLNDYARHFDVLRHIRFNTAVQSTYYDGFNWQVRVKDAAADRPETLTFSFVVVCTGTFHEPYLPEVPGLQSFEEAGGKVLHSSAVSSDAMLKDKNVLVVGFAKSATDIVTRAADIARSATLVFRKAQWKVPRFFGNKVNMRYLLFSRCSEAFFNAPRKTVFQRFLHSIGKPLVWLQWRGLETLLKKQFRLKKCGMVPTHRIEDQISCSLGVEPVGFYKKVESGVIQAHCTEIDHCSGRDVVLKNGAVLQPDVLVFGTGFRQRLPFLSAQYQEQLTDTQGIYWLYRNIVHPDVPQMAFVGFNSSLFSTLTSEVAASWVAASVDGSMILPPREEMIREMQQMVRWRNQGRPIAREFSGLCVAPFNFLHLDELMRDMGLRTRASYNFLYDFIKPINPKDYARTLHGRARRAAA